MRALLTSLTFFFTLLGMCQGVERILVEEYHRMRTEEGDLVTYRIHVDMAPGYEMQMVYGDARNQLEIETTTVFHNDTIDGSRYANAVNLQPAERPLVLFDTWFTIGAASDRHWGVPLYLDPDGSIVKIDGLVPNDGLVEQEVKNVINFKLESGYLHRIPGSRIHTMDGAWAVLGGTKGITEENMVLIAQITTTGELSFKLNLQLRSPSGDVEKYVSTIAGDAEILFLGLRYGKFVIQ